MIPDLARYSMERIAAACEYHQASEDSWFIWKDAVRDGHRRSFLLYVGRRKFVWEMEVLHAQIRFVESQMIVDIYPRGGDKRHLRRLTLNDEWSFNQADEISEGEFGRALGRGNDPARWIYYYYGHEPTGDPFDPEWKRLYAIYGEP